MGSMGFWLFAQQRPGWIVAIDPDGTDREICGQLYLSPKTVEFHLGRVYRKLSVRGRTELARRLPGF